MNDLIIAKNLVREYSDIQIVKHVSISILQGEFSVILGPSGSGKTTLLNLLSGLDRPTSGKITLDGTEITGLDEDGLALLRRAKVGFIFQTFNLIPTLTALINIELPLYPAGVGKVEMEKRAYALLELMGMKDKANHFPGMLSGGEKQRVAIARALINNPRIVFADEPTGNLDTNTGGEVIKLMKRLNKERNMSFLIVTHNEGFSSEADRVFRMRDGRLE
jgi:putative ABC transport system ATP-binding protein